jgi:hypothetical protein
MAPTTLLAVNPDERLAKSPISVTNPLKLTLKDSMVAVFAVDLSAILFVY